MNESNFVNWVHLMRSEVLRIWDELGIPPRVGINENDIIDQFRKLESYSTHDMLIVDELTGTKDVIRNTSLLGTSVNQWFPTMMSTKINYTKDITKGLSIYDHFKKPDLLEKVIKYSRRNFKRDSFYNYSQVVRSGNDILDLPTDSAISWIKEFENKYRGNCNFDYWLEPKFSTSKYTGYNESLRGNTTYNGLIKETKKSADFLFMSEEEFQQNIDLIPEQCTTNIDTKDGNGYIIRLFELGQRIFPIGLRAFKLSWCQPANNYPPMIAKFLYKTYASKFDRHLVKVYDPSCGWGGRILGAMCTVLPKDRVLHYIGTDPNKDHTLEDGTTKYHDIADYYNNVCKVRNRLIDVIDNTYEIYQCGSEVFHENPNFSNHINDVSVVFTSPPYFGKELYSQDEEQSAIKYPEYQMWIDNFLYITIKNAHTLLHSGGYLILNIADAKFGSELLPMQQDTQRICESFGFKFVQIYKMSLAQMPGDNRVANNKLVTNNSCKVKQSNSKKCMLLKYEPIFVYQKP